LTQKIKFENEFEINFVPATVLVQSVCHPSKCVL